MHGFLPHQFFYVLPHSFKQAIGLRFLEYESNQESQFHHFYYSATLYSVLDSPVYSSLAGTDTSEQKKTQNRATWILPLKHRLYHVQEGCNSNRSLVTENFLRCLHFSISGSEGCAVQCFHLPQYGLNSQIRDSSTSLCRVIISAFLLLFYNFLLIHPRSH